MPIANCFIKNKKLGSANLSDMISDWASLIDMDPDDICINVISDFIQLGKNYSVLVNLYLPTVLADKDIKHIQKNLLSVLQKHLEVTPDKILILTTSLHSGRILENGEIVVW